MPFIKPENKANADRIFAELTKNNYIRPNQRVSLSELAVFALLIAGVIVMYAANIYAERDRAQQLTHLVIAQDTVTVNNRLEVVK